MSEQPTDGNLESIRQAVDEIRTEGYKAAGIHAVVDGVVAFLLVNLLGGVAPIKADTPIVGPLSMTALTGLGVGVLVFGGEFWLRARQYTIKRFEADNPAVAEALRTARDAANTEHDSVMTRRLYADVTDRLAETNSTGFVNMPWLTTSIVLVLVLSVATIQTAAVGPGPDRSVVPPNTTNNDSMSLGGPDGGTSNNQETTLRDGTQVLGNPQNVSDGAETLSANISGLTGAQEGSQRNEYTDSGLPDDTGVTAQRASFDDRRELANAALVREYTLRLQARDDE